MRLIRGSQRPRCYSVFFHPMTSSPVKDIVCAHSPDSDDAFMFYGLATKKIRSRFVNIKHVLEDIESLNRKAMEGVYELTAISYHAYPYVADKYVLMASGSSVGDGYGPMVIANRPMQPEELKGKRIAIPGKMTTAYLAMRIIEPDFEAVPTPFDRIEEAVREHAVDAGLVIHEAQLTFGKGGLPQRTRPGPLVEEDVQPAASARRQCPAAIAQSADSERMLPPDARKHSVRTRQHGRGAELRHAVRP